ncbi:MAG: hypothetical protein COB04_15305 [Gammaproteobacteria bacterium]|nr:MAG: hypothetical protein COB04_15305 [Gammaproteobacteria bacterium]
MKAINASHSTNLLRRKLMLGLGAFSIAPTLLAIERSRNSTTLNEEIWVSAQGKHTDRYGLSWGNPLKAASNTHLSGFRGHGISLHPRKPHTVMMYARRPGTQGVELDLKTGRINHRLKCQVNRHLLGHGCFSRDGQTLFTTEANLQSTQGLIVARDSETYEVLAEFESGGIGPHEVSVLPDGKTLVVANGGIYTHPDSGRKQLNLDTMASNLSYIDLSSGDILESHTVAEAKASIRHLDVALDGTVAFAMQMQRGASSHNKVVSLAGLHAQGRAIQLFDHPEQVIFRMKDYAGSVVISPKTRVVGFTSPKGNIAVFWHVDSKQYIGHHAMHDVCGLAVSADQRHFILSNSLGELRYLSAITLNEDKNRRVRMPKMSFDNHLLVLNEKLNG